MTISNTAKYPSLTGRQLTPVIGSERPRLAHTDAATVQLLKAAALCRGLINLISALCIGSRRGTALYIHFQRLAPLHQQHKNTSSISGLVPIIWRLLDLSLLLLCRLVTSVLLRTGAGTGRTWTLCPGTWAPPPCTRPRGPGWWTLRRMRSWASGLPTQLGELRRSRRRRDAAGSRR